MVSLLEAVGELTQRHDGKYLVTIGQDRAVIERPHRKDIGEELAADLRRMLTHAGYTSHPDRED